MGTEQYHEPPGELTQEMRTFARMAASLQEEAEAIGWYEQRMSLERDAQARAIMEDAQEEEFKHFAMALEFLSRRKPKWQVVLKDVLFKSGDIVEHGEEAEEEEKRTQVATASAIARTCSISSSFTVWPIPGYSFMVVTAPMRSKT